jgi:hypothetical protein
VVVETEHGQVYEMTYCIIATGPLSILKGLDMPGRDTFKCDIYLTGRWPHEPVDFAGKRVRSSGRALFPDYMAQVKANYPRPRTIARSKYTGGVRPISARLMFSMTKEEAQKLLQDGWDEGGQAIFGLSPNSSATRSNRRLGIRTPPRC